MDTQKHGGLTLPIPPSPRSPTASPTSESGGKSQPAKTPCKEPHFLPPRWRRTPRRRFFLEILRAGTIDSIVGTIVLEGKGLVFFGRGQDCDVLVDDPTVSDRHAVLVFDANERPFLYDMGSPNGTFVNNSKITQEVYIGLSNGDFFSLGRCCHCYIFKNEPTEWRPAHEPDFSDHSMPIETAASLLNKKHTFQTVIRENQKKIAAEQQKLFDLAEDEFSADPLDEFMAENSVELISQLVNDIATHEAEVKRIDDLLKQDFSN